MDLRKTVVDVFDIGAEASVSVVSSMFLEGIAGQIAPGVMSTMLAYKQKRSEKMIERFMIETKARLDEFEDKLICRDEATVREIKDKYFGIVMDYVIETKQEEKIQYIVNGFINIADMQVLQEDVILLFYDMLSELNILDLRVLKLYDYLYNNGDDYSKIIDETGISYDEYKLIQSKLERLGFIESKAQASIEEIFQNVKNIGEYLVDFEKGKKSKLKYNKLGAGSLNSKYLTGIGRQFLRFFIGKEASTEK